MTACLIVEFEGQTREQYETAGTQLGIDLIGGTGDWLEGLLSHAAGATAIGWFVVEVSSSRAEQERFLEDRLRPPSTTPESTVRPHASSGSS